MCIRDRIYIDGADEATKNKHLIKGGGGALTREKIIAAASEQFVCIIDDTKLVPLLGSFPLPVEVVPMAQSYVAREITKLGGQPELRQNFTKFIKFSRKMCRKRRFFDEISGAFNNHDRPRKNDP